MGKSILSLQTHTIRDFMKSGQDVQSSMKKLRKIGFDFIELGSVPGLDDVELAKILKGEGLKASGYAGDSRLIVEEPGKVIASMDALGVSHVMYAWPHTMPKDAAAWKSLAKLLDKAGAVYAKAGKTLLYHNHSVEFEKLDGKLALDILFDESDPKLLQAEIDTYWIHHGGGDPAAWCRKLKGRLPFLHLKDYGIVNSEGALMQPRIFEVGRGNLDWEGILAAAKESGCKCFIIEQDTCPGCPFDSLKISFDYISPMIREL